MWLVLIAALNGELKGLERLQDKNCCWVKDGCGPERKEKSSVMVLLISLARCVSMMSLGTLDRESSSVTACVAF